MAGIGLSLTALPLAAGRL